MLKKNTLYVLTLFTLLPCSVRAIKNGYLAPLSIYELSGDLAIEELLNGEPVYVDVSDTLALPPEGDEVFSSHEIALINMVSDDREIFPNQKGPDRISFISACEKGYSDFLGKRRSHEISVEDRYKPLLEPFAGRLHRRHFEQLVGEWRLNNRFLDGVKLMRDAAGLAKDHPFEIVSGNLAPINRAFLERADVREIIQANGIRFSDIQGIDLEFDGEGFFQGNFKANGNLFYADADQFPDNCFVIGDDSMEKYGFSPFLINVQTFDPELIIKRIENRRKLMKRAHRIIINRHVESSASDL